MTLVGSYNEDIVKQACDISMCTHKENEQTDNNGSNLCTTCDLHRMKVNCLSERKQSNVITNKVSITKQSGGYF